MNSFWLDVNFLDHGALPVREPLEQNMAHWANKKKGELQAAPLRNRICELKSLEQRTKIYWVLNVSLSKGLIFNANNTVL